MRPELPWNVAGIPPEAREAARAAARREGLSVGEWLTRRILRSFSDAGDETATERWSAGPMFRADEHMTSTRRDTDEMLSRVSRSENETNDIYRRIEEQLRGVARRLDSTERSQSETNRAMSKAATEINIATREQAQSFDQLGAHVVGLADRLERVERSESGSGMKDAVKGLHTGLTRLADQISQTASQSAAQISSLANNLEAVSGRLVQARQETENTSRALDQRIAVLDERVRAVEKAAQTSTNALERALEGMETRQAARAESDAESGRREAMTAGAIARLEENFGRLEARGPDPALDRRLTGIERTLSDIAGRLDSIDPGATKQIEDSVKKLVGRVEAAESRQREQVTELRAAMNEPPARVGSGLTPPSIFDAPPFPDADPGMGPAQHLPFHAQADAFATAPQAAFDTAAAFGTDHPFPPAQAFGVDAFAPVQPEQQADSYLSAARRSARAAAAQAEAERGRSGFSWGAAAPTAPVPAKRRTRTLLLAIAVLVAIALIAGVMLSQNILGQPNRASGVGALFPVKPQTAPAQMAPKPATTTLPSGDDDTLDTGAPTATTSSAPIRHAPVVLAPLQQQVVKPAPIHAVPQQSAAQTTAPQQAAAQVTAPPQATAVPALDRLTALANGGNAKAELIVGLKYLDGDGVQQNEAQAAKWLERAAESGEPVAQYRMGTLYERGKGLAADPVKATHWYQAAAMQGNRKAMHNLAVAFADGSGTKKDLAEAARWFSKAAGLGLADSQFNLAVLYERGLGVPQSLIDAYKWYAVAASQGDTESKARIDALSTQLGADDRAAAQHAADTFKPTPLDARANVPPQMADLHG
jgi:localization factor PodJL